MILTELDLMEICFVVIRSDENLSTIDWTNRSFEAATSVSLQVQYHKTELCHARATNHIYSKKVRRMRTINKQTVKNEIKRKKTEMKGDRKL